jgi:hypothetical protein
VEWHGLRLSGARCGRDAAGKDARHLCPSQRLRLVCGSNLENDPTALSLVHLENDGPVLGDKVDGSEPWILYTLAQGDLVCMDLFTPHQVGPVTQGEQP